MRILHVIQVKLSIEVTGKLEWTKLIGRDLLSSLPQVLTSVLNLKKALEGLELLIARC